MVSGLWSLVSLSLRFGCHRPEHVVDRVIAADYLIRKTSRRPVNNVIHLLFVMRVGSFQEKSICREECRTSHVPGSLTVIAAGQVAKR